MVELEADILSYVQLSRTEHVQSTGEVHTDPALYQVLFHTVIKRSLLGLTHV